MSTHSSRPPRTRPPRSSSCRPPAPGRWRRSSSCTAATRCSPTTAPSTTWPRALPKASSSTSPTSNAGFPPRRSCCSWTSPASPPCWPRASAPPAASGTCAPRNLQTARERLRTVLAAAEHTVAHCCATRPAAGADGRGRRDQHRRLGCGSSSTCSVSCWSGVPASCWASSPAIRALSDRQAGVETVGRLRDRAGLLRTTLDADSVMWARRGRRRLTHRQPSKGLRGERPRRWREEQ